MSEQGRHRYAQWQEMQEKRWESLCGRCGACCGAVEGDPCEHLRGSKKGDYYCSIYENRFGLHKTLSGKPFLCVPIRKVLHESWPGDECCGYKKEMRSIKLDG
jgi:uncharacterized cysteine cluster protein YcgN (CxxCxxCC family)